jgi:hypothetical protein
LFSYGAPVLPLNSRTLPDVRRFSLLTEILIADSGFASVHAIRASSTSFGVAPSKTGEATGVGPLRLPFSPNTPWYAAQPRCVSRIWPMFIRLGTPSGFRTTSTGVPSSRNGMSSEGTILAMTPLLPCRPASLSPSAILRFFAT